MRDLARPAGRDDATVSDGVSDVTLGSLRTSGTAEPSRTLSRAMPICRIHVSPPAAAQQQETVRLSRYIVTRRMAPRAANDNRSSNGRHVWPWALAIAVAPTVTAVLLFAGLL